MMHTMGRDRIQQQVTPDLFSTASPLGEPSPLATLAQERRHVLPKDLANAVKHLTDQELDLLITVCVEEAKRRGKIAPERRVE